MYKAVFLISIIFYNFFLSDCARILAVFPTPSISHQVVFRPLIQELAKRGHEVTVLTPDPAFPKSHAPKNLTEIDVHDMSYDYWRKGFLSHVTGKKSDLKQQIKVIYDIMEDIFFMQLNNSEFKRILDEKQNFDLLILEAWFRPTLALSHIFKAPVIQMSSFGRVWHNYENVGAPVHPILYPLSVRQRLYNLTVLEKITELYADWQYKYMINEIEIRNNARLKETFGADFPSLEELSNNIDMLFLNIHPIWEGNTPLPPSVVHTWGIHQTPVKELPVDLKSYIENSKNGVIYMSFGTNTDPANLPQERIQIFIKVFSKLPYNILWKWNNDVLPGKWDNIRISKWFPQPDLLRHPKIKLFITQGGLQSTDEAIIAGVPMIGIPMLGDQWYNTEKYVYHGIGLQLNIETLTEQELRNAIGEVIENESYRRNIKKLSSLMRDEPIGALRRAVWWVEHVLRHGGARHLRAPAANISWAHYLELELVATLLAALLLVLTLSISVIYICFRINKMYFIGKKSKTH